MKKKQIKKIFRSNNSNIASTANVICYNLGWREYFFNDFESATDTMGWTSANAPGDMSIATDEDNSINKYFKFANTNGSGTRNAYYTFDSDAQTTENGKAVIEFDFYMTNTGNENINQLVLLDSAAGKPKGNANYSGNNYIFSFTQPKNSDKLIINNLDGSKETYTTTDWTINQAGHTQRRLWILQSIMLDNHIVKS